MIATSTALLIGAGVLAAGATASTITSVSAQNSATKSQKSAAEDAVNKSKALAEEAKNASIVAEEKAKQDARAKLAGQTQTIFTTPLGTVDTAAVAKKTLLGA